MEDKEMIEENTISLAEIYNVIKKRFLFLVFTTLLGGLILGGYAFLIATPKYQSTGAIMVQVKSTGTEVVNTVESQRLVQTTVELLTMLVPTEINRIAEHILISEIRENMNVSNTSGSLLIQITYISEDPELAESMVKLIIETLIDVTQSDSFNMEHTLKDNISNLFVSPARYHSPNKILITFVGLILGGTLGLVLVFAFELVNTGYKTKEEVENELNIQVLGEIPEFKIK